MSRSVNKVILVGRIGADPEIKLLPNGNHVVNFNIATDEGYTHSQTQEKVDKTEWHRITAFGKLAEIIGQYSSKGQLVYIEGKLKTESWADGNGNKKFITKIIASELNMLEFKEKNKDDSDSSEKTTTANNFIQSKLPKESNFDDFDDDIPF